MLNAERKPVTGRRVQLMATCLCDAFYDDVAAATVEVLEQAGVEVSFPEGQTCCGQPAFNGGDWAASRKVVRHTVRTFAGEDPVVVPSGSCAAMLFHGAVLEFEGQPDLPEVEALGRRTWELADYLVNGLGVRSWPGRYDAKVALHRSCHTRGTASVEAALTLLRAVAGVEVVEFGEPEQCCGFGGTFAVSYPHLSTAMGALKLDHVRAAQPDVYVAVDMSCMMHLGGLAEKEGKPIRTQHLAQVLRDALKGGRRN
ncbi:MAG: (Fe-S)-binding protein [Verrucomicrobia bacterium]|nr:(Fe-S)-binding protein [Verrucomicrobiota bacterium]